MKRYCIEPKGYNKEIVEYSNMNPELRPIRLNEKLNKNELIHLLPIKLNNTQLALLYSVYHQSHQQ